MPVKGYAEAASRTPAIAATRTPLRRLLPAVPHLVRTTPLRFLILACATGLGISFVSAQLLSSQRSAAGVLLINSIATAPVAAATAFLVFALDQELVAALPAPSWLPHVVHLATALPVIGLTASVQLSITHTEALRVSAPAQPGQLSWTFALAQFIAWVAVSTATAAAVNRTRWHDLGGAVAMPLALALITLLSVVPYHSPQYWWTITAAAAIVAVWQSRDPRLRRISAPWTGGDMNE